MNILRRIIKAIQSPYHLPGSAADWTPDWLVSAGFHPSRSDDPPPGTSIGMSPVYAAVSLLAGALAGNDLQLIRRRNGAVERLTNGAIPILLMDTEFATIESWLWDSLIGGNGYLRKVRDNRGAVASLEWLPAHRMSVAISDAGQLWYELAEDGTIKEKAETIAASEIIHLRMRQNGRHRYLGVSPLVTCAPSLGLVYHTRRSGVSVYRNSAFPTVLIQHQKGLSPEAIQRIKMAWMQATGTDKQGTPVVLHDGMTAEPFSISKAIDLQLAEMTKLGVAEVARVYGVPVTLLGEAQESNYSSAAEQSRSFVTHSLQPWARRVGDCLTHSLLDRTARLDGQRIAFDLAALTRGHGKELSEHLSQLVNSGVATLNEARSMIGLPNIDGGDTVRCPSNTYSLEAWADWTPQPNEAQQKALIDASVNAFIEGNGVQKMADTWLTNPSPVDPPEPPTKAELQAELEAMGLSLDDLFANGDIAEADYERLED